MGEQVCFKQEAGNVQRRDCDIKDSGDDHGEFRLLGRFTLEGSGVGERQEMETSSVCTSLSGLVYLNDS